MIYIAPIQVTIQKLSQPLRAKKKSFEARVDCARKNIQ